MKTVTLLAQVDADKCNGCRICVRICPTLSVEIQNKKAVVDAATCSGCANCEQRCPEYAVIMVKREVPVTVGVSLEGVDPDRVHELCAKARLNPEQLVCYCTATRAEEVAAAVIKGAGTPEEISRVTGVRTGCKVECIQPVLRLLEAAGLSPKPPKGGWQWYGRTATVWEVPQDVRDRFSSRGFYFDEDIKLLDRVVEAEVKGDDAK